ncbi:M1 family aminopeptidase [Granulicella arctica]|uniref:M1 family aminopeptidase n=1 Tax=Granulicella arctica TaxID=940613 RepID=UPI0021DF6185|nr:M1 family aminopeptidase [Granulicella arctica]
MRKFATALFGLALLPAGFAQEIPQSQSGTVLFSTEKKEPSQAVHPSVTDALPEMTAAGRDAPTFINYDLDVHLAPAKSQITVRSSLDVRNDGTEPLRYLALQISSTLMWESFAISGAEKNTPVIFGQHEIDTDADHTGKANEAIITLPQPLAPGAVVSLTAFYSGEIRPSAERLERIGAPVDQAASADWDQISAESTAIRGFGDVLWYPVAAEPVFLGDGAKLFQAVGKNRLRQAQTKIHLRLTVQYVGDPPDAAFFCGRREQFVATSENQDVPVVESPGIATADFEAEKLGFRSPSLFLTDRAATVTSDTLIAAVTDHYDALPQYGAGAALVKPLLTEWLGTVPLSQLMILDHSGQPFEDGAFLVLPMRASSAATLAPSLVHTLAHAWFRSTHPWLDEGVSQFMSLLWTEQNQGRAAAVEMLQQQANALALVEPEIVPGNDNVGQSLIHASDDVYYRTKASAVLWMLRSAAGDDALKQTLIAYRKDRKQDSDPVGFELALEKNSHKDLRWFFDDWVYRDRGLPDLTIVNVTPRALPPQGGKPAGWLVSAEVRNDGDAVADVPVTVRSGTLSATERLRIPGHSSTSTRILFEGTPDEVQVNDGTVPEMRNSVHTIQVRVRTQ